jgi:hypothetical protein
MTSGPLGNGVRQLLETVRREEWTFLRALTDEERERPSADGAPEIRELICRASEARAYATLMLREVAAGRAADGCAEPPAGPVGTWDEVHHRAHEAMTELHAALDAMSEEQLALNPGPVRSHPQYLWRDITNMAVRGPMLSYGQWHRRHGRDFESLAVLGRWYEAVRATDLPTKALSDASYDLACGLSLAGRGCQAMRYLPDAFTYNDRAAVGVLKAWAREDPDLAPLADRPDFRTLVGSKQS